MQGKDIAEEYSKIEAEQKRVALLDWDRSHPSSVHGAGSSFLSSVFGSVAAVCSIYLGLVCADYIAWTNETDAANDFHRAEAG